MSERNREVVWLSKESHNILKEVKLKSGLGLAAQVDQAILNPVIYANDILTSLNLSDELYVELVNVLCKVRMEMKGI